MPKAKPISLYPLTFDQVLDLLLNTPPETKAVKESRTTRPTKRKKRKRQRSRT